MSMLNINDLFTNKNEKEKLKEQIYDDVLKQCHKKILRAAKLNPYTNYCFYVIPKFIYGIPLYDLNKCINSCIVTLNISSFLQIITLFLFK